jgi:hypothetical protein
MKIDITKQPDNYLLTLSTDEGVVGHAIPATKEDLIKIRNAITLFIGFETDRIKKEGAAAKRQGPDRSMPPP